MQQIDGVLFHIPWSPNPTIFPLDPICKKSAINAGCHSFPDMFLVAKYKFYWQIIA